MRKMVNFCDLCGASDIWHLARYQYTTNAGEIVDICASCVSVVKGAGLNTWALGSEVQLLVEDITEGLIADSDA